MTDGLIVIRPQSNCHVKLESAKDKKDFKQQIKEQCSEYQPYEKSWACKHWNSIIKSCRLLDTIGR